MVVRIGRRFFLSKREAIEYFSRKLREMMGKGVFWDDELYELFKHHPRFLEKTRGLRVVGFVVEVNPRYRRDFTPYAVLEDGTRIDFSYRKCIDGAFDPLARKRIRRVNTVLAFRKAVEDQVIEFKRSRQIGDMVLLDNGTLAPADQVHVHHEPPFMELLREFLRTRGLSLEQVPIQEASDGVGYEIADEKLLREWREFHRERARLVLVKKEEHYRLHSGRR